MIVRIHKKKVFGVGHIGASYLSTEITLAYGYYYVNYEILKILLSLEKYRFI